MTESVPPQSAEMEEAREPKGYVVKYSLASFGLFLAILTPVLGGLVIKIQTINDGDLDRSAVQLALVTGVGAIFALFTQPLAGRLSDLTTGKMGRRRPWIIVGVTGVAISLTIIGFASNITLVLIGWCLAQVFSNMAQAAETATIPDQVPTARRGLVSGVVGAATPLGILGGSILLSSLPTDLLRFVVPGLIGLVLGLIFAVTLKDKVLEKRPGGAKFGIKEIAMSLVFNPKKHPSFGWAWLTKFLVMFGYASVGSYLLLFLAAKYGMTDSAEQAQFNMYASMVAVAFMVLFSFFGGKLSDKIGRRKMPVTVGGIVMSIGLLLIALSPFFGMSVGLVVILIGEALLGAGAGMFLAVDMALCTEVLPNPDDSAKDLGVLNIANALPQSLAPLFAGPVILMVNSNTSGDLGYTVWFTIGAVTALLGSLLVTKIKGVK